FRSAKRRSFAERKTTFTPRPALQWRVVSALRLRISMPPSSASNRPLRPLVPVSLPGLLVVTAMIAMGLGFYRLAGPKALVHYAFLIFAVGPWFAWLVSECLPIHTSQLRTAAANMILLLLFI